MSATPVYTASTDVELPSEVPNVVTALQGFSTSAFLRGVNFHS